MSHGGSTCTCGTMHHRAACIPLHTTHHFMPPRMSILAHPPFKKTMRFHAANYRSVYPTHASQLSALSTLAMLRCTIILTHLVPCFTSPQSPHPCLNNRTHNVPPRSPHSPDRTFRTPPAHLFQTSSHTLTPAAHVFCKGQDPPPHQGDPLPRLPQHRRKFRDPGGGPVQGKNEGTS